MLSLRTLVHWARPRSPFSLSIEPRESRPSPAQYAFLSSFVTRCELAPVDRPGELRIVLVRAAEVDQLREITELFKDSLRESLYGSSSPSRSAVE